MEKKFCIFVLVLCVCFTGCGVRNNKNEEGIELEKNINLEITEYIKSNLADIWSYSEDKFKIYDNHSVEIVFSNVDDWSYCAYNTNNAIVSLSKYRDELLKEIPNITFVCKKDSNKIAKVVYENIYEISKENVESNAKYYDSNDNLINESAESGFKKSCNIYKYRDIFRNPENYIFKRAKITGEVIQVIEEVNSGIEYWVLRVNMTKDSWGYYSDTIMIMIQKSAINGRIIEDDIFTFYGLLGEPITYETIFGAEQTVPSMLAIYGDLKN